MLLNNFNSFLILLIMFFVMCSSPGNYDEVKTITEEDYGKTIDVLQNEEFKLILVGNPTTGYSWFIKLIDTLIVKQIGDNYKFEPFSDLDGSPGNCIFRFKTLTLGLTDIKLEYLSDLQAPVDSFQVKIEVK